MPCPSDGRATATCLASSATRTVTAIVDRVPSATDLVLTLIHLLLRLHGIRLRGSFARPVADGLFSVAAHTGPLAARSRSKRPTGVVS